MAFLKIVEGAAKGRRFEIDRDDMIVGRSPGNAIVIDDPSVSSEHCRITRQGRRFILRDLDSTNGTQLNDVAISEHQLSAGDTILVGSVEVLFDGDDIDGYQPVPPADEPAQVTLKLPATNAKPMTPAAFGARKSKRWSGILFAVLAGVAILSAMAFFLFRLFGE